MFSGDQGSHLVFTKILVEFVSKHQSLVWFPTVGTRVIASPSNKELHAGSFVMITTMRYDISDHEFLLVLLSYFYRINLIRTEEKGSQIVDMSLDLLALKYMKYMDCFRPLT